MALAKGKGGIRKGQVAADAAARKIDKDLKHIRDELQVELEPKFAGLKMQKRYNKKETRTPCEPDGGLWFYNEKLICAFEAKKQQDRGNAIERWYKNLYICRSILNPEVSYGTWARGDGAHAAGQIGKCIDAAHEGGFNVYVPGGNSCWLSRDGFSKREIKNQMRKMILERIEHYDSK